MSELAATERALLTALGTIAEHWAALVEPSSGGGSGGTASSDVVTGLDRRVSLRHEVTLSLRETPTRVVENLAVWDNWNAPGGAANTGRGLTRSSDSTREKAGMKPTGLLPTRSMDPQVCADMVSSDRWSAKVDTTGDCHLWTAATNTGGYGWIGVGRSAFLAHRVSYVAHRGVDIPTGYVIDHLCRQPSCVNPEHLEAVSTRTNTLRGEARAAHQARQTVCVKGHPLSEPDPRRGGRRKCQTCTDARGNERAALERRARSLVGMTQAAYRARYGNSLSTHAAIIAAHEETP